MLCAQLGRSCALLIAPFAAASFACCGSLLRATRSRCDANDANKYLREWRGVKNFRMQTLGATNRKSCVSETQLLMRAAVTKASVGDQLQRGLAVQRSEKQRGAKKGRAARTACWLVDWRLRVLELLFWRSLLLLAGFSGDLCGRGSGRSK